MSIFDRASKKIVTNVKTEALSSVSPVAKIIGTLVGLYLVFSDELKPSIPAVRETDKATTINNIIIFDKNGGVKDEFRIG